MTNQSFDRATEFVVEKLEIDGKTMDGSMFFALEVFEHAFVSGITGRLTVVETTSNQFLDENKIEGNERISIWISTPDDDSMRFEGYINKISDRTVTANGVMTYNIEFVSPTIRENEQKRMTKRFKNVPPDDIASEVLQTLNKESEVEIKQDKMMGGGNPMNFVCSRWKPIAVIQYVQKHGVPNERGGSTSDTGSSEQEITGKGTGGFLFFETMKGFRFGSGIEFLSGDLSDGDIKEFKQTLANQTSDIDENRSHIMSFETIRNNDTQTQQRGGAFRSQLVSMNMDTGEYKEQTWESDMATDKQKLTSKAPTRVFARTLSNERFNQECHRETYNSVDQSLRTIQQEAGTINNITDGMCRFTTPSRTDVSVGDKVDLSIYETSHESDQELDKKYSGKWIVSGVAHHFLRETNSAYSRITCLRSTNQVDEGSAEKVDFKNK